MRTLRILLADDDAMVRTGLSQILAADERITVVTQAADGAEAVAASAAYRPDIVLMDIRMPGMDGVEATRRLANAVAAPYIVALTSFDSGTNVIRMLEAGAAGFIAKDVSPAELVRALEIVESGESFISPSSTKNLIAMIGRGSAATEQHEARQALRGLTERERAVADLVWAGRSNAQIAAELFTSESTVKTHLKAISIKLAVDGRVQMAIVVERGR